MSVKINIRGDIFLVQPSGNINMQISIEFDSLLKMAIEDGFINIIFDFSEMTNISSEGLHVILKIIRILISKNGKVFFVSMNPNVQKIFKLSGFMSLLDEFSTVEEAIKAINDADS